MSHILYMIMHLQDVIVPLFNWLGNWSYLILFTVTFMETGLVIFPWLPGVSLVFVAASVAAITPSVKISILISGFFLAALLGDTVNYLIGTQLIKWSWLRKRVMGPRLDQTQAFFERHGIIAVIFGRFVPVIRTFIPLISGSAGFPWHKLMIGNFIGVALWVALAAVMGYYFGSIPFVKDHFSLVIIGIVAISFLPAGIVYGLRSIRRKIITRRRF